MTVYCTITAISTATVIHRKTISILHVSYAKHLPTSSRAYWINITGQGLQLLPSASRSHSVPPKINLNDIQPFLQEVFPTKFYVHSSSPSYATSCPHNNLPDFTILTIFSDLHNNTPPL